jgi:Rad3-related DNA helicase/serine/threonine protein kinase
MANVELQQVGTYTLSQVLRVSSTGTYYLGKRQGKKTSFVIKRLTIPLTTDAAKAAFLKRAKQLKKLVDRSIINVDNFGLDGDFGYLALEYVEGETLRHTIPPGKQLEPDEVRILLSSLASGLQYAHTNHVLHNNLSPDAIIARNSHTPVLTEFSLSLPEFGLVLDDEEFAFPYMAPEHLQGQPTAASDQYALAVMAYEWLCGRRPYDAIERTLLLSQQQKQTIPEPRHLNSRLSSAAQEVLLQALSYQPEQRFPHVQAFADSYLRALTGLPLKMQINGASIPVRPSLTHLDMPEKAGAAQTAPRRSPARPDQPVDNATRRTPLGVPRTAHLRVVRAEEEETEQVPEEEEVALTDITSPESEVEARQENSRLHSIVVADLRQGGVLSRRLPGYEERLVQIEMATLVARALTEQVPALLEAATGTGKSLAYLIPIVRSGKVAIISTANKALQEQLFYKDIPFVQKHIKRFEAALVKGVSNYVCLDRVENERISMFYHTKNEQFKRLLDIVNDEDSHFSGDFETLDFQLPADIRGRIATDSDQCAWSKCSFFGNCYVRRMRDQAEKAQIIVVNHTLLLLDAAIGGFLLPSRDMIVLDEAHHLEEEATRAFTIAVSPYQIQLLLAQKLLKAHSQLSLQAEAERAAQQTWLQLSQVADPGYKGRINLEEPLEDGLRLSTAISDLADSLRKQRPKDMSDKDEQLYDKLLKRTQNLAENVRTVFSVADTSSYVYYVERVQTPGQRGFQLQVSAAPLDVTSWLKERLFDKYNVICTSATLATVGPNPAHPEEKGPNFAYYRRRIGLDPLERPDVIERILPLAFDYESNALLYLPRDLPAPTFGPGSDDYMRSIAREMYRLVKLSRGRAFLLFSSKRMLDRAYELMAPHLSYPLLKQGDMTRLELTRRFREEEGAVLFGLKSFWEGVDIAGEALSLVVIDKLPFDPPDDPVHEARVAQMKAAGENWFGTYVLPQAVLRLKQGLGRLLRTRDDRGVMAILDTRLHTKGYGKLVLDALPPARRTSSIRDVERFFAED